MKPVFACNWLQFYVRLSNNCAASVLHYLSPDIAAKRTRNIYPSIKKLNVDSTPLISQPLYVKRQSKNYSLTENLPPTHSHVTCVYNFPRTKKKKKKKICIHFSNSLVEVDARNFIPTSIFDRPLSEIRRWRSRLSSAEPSRVVVPRPIDRPF